MLRVATPTAGLPAVWKNAFTASIHGPWNAMPKPLVVRLGRPIRRVLGEKVRLRKSHFLKRMLGEGGSRSRALTHHDAKGNRLLWPE
jgi:hypothetical protein